MTEEGLAKYGVDCPSVRPRERLSLRDGQSGITYLSVRQSVRRGAARKLCWMDGTEYGVDED